MPLSSDARGGRLTALAAVLAVMAWPPAHAAAEAPPAPVVAVTQLNLDRYMGQWFEIARTPNPHEEACAGDVVNTYERRSESSVGMVNVCRRADGDEDRQERIARVRDVNSHAKLEVRYAPRTLAWLPFVWDDYWVLDVGEHYDYALVGEPRRESLWILSRTPTMERATYDSLVAQAAAQGYDTSKLMRTLQSARRRVQSTVPAVIR